MWLKAVGLGAGVQDSGMKNEMSPCVSEGMETLFPGTAVSTRVNCVPLPRLFESHLVWLFVWIVRVIPVTQDEAGNGSPDQSAGWSLSHSGHKTIVWRAELASIFTTR